MTNRQNESLEGREVGIRDFKSQETISLTANTLGIVGTSHKGPAFVPHTFLTYEKDDTEQGVLNTFEETFGSINDLKEANIPQFTAFEWFNQGGEQLTFTRILGMGLTGKPDNEGIVQGSGFVVGQSVVSGSTTLGKAGGNSYATAANASAGKTHFIGSTFKNNQFTDSSSNKISTFNDYLQQIGFKSNVLSKSMITDVVFCPSGSEIFLESGSLSSLKVEATRDSLSNQQYTGNIDKKSDKINPKIFIRGLSLRKFNMVNSISDITNQHNIVSSRFNESVYNRDPDYVLHKGHLNYASYYPQLGSFSFNDTDKFFIVTGSNDQNTPSYEDFQSTFTTAKTPWIVSQPLDREGLSDNRVDMHTKCEKLFRFYALDDGEIGNRYRIRVQPQRKGNRKTKDWSRFTVKVWELNKEMTGFNELLEYRDLTLDPNSTDYIGFVFGTKHEYFNIVTNKVQTEGRYETGNSHLRVEVNPKIEFKQIEAYEIVPSGFMPYPRLNTSGLELPNAGDVIQKPLDYVSNILFISKALGSNIDNTELIDSKYWGVLFDKTRPVFIRKVEINNENYQLRAQAIINTNSIKKHYYSYTKYFQNNYNEPNKSKNVWFEDLKDNNEDTFNAFFHLEKILYTGNETDSQFWKKAMYRRDGINPSAIESLVGAKSHYQYINIDQFLESSDGQDSTHIDYLSFDFFTYGGFDGVNILDRDKRLMNQSAFIREIEDESNNGSTTGPTRFAYELGHKTIVDDSNCEVDLLVFPDIGHNAFNKEVSTAAGENRRYLTILNAAEHFSTGINLNANLHIVDPTVDDSTTKISLTEGVGNSLAGGINATVNSISGYYYNNKYTLNVCNTLEGVIDDEVNIDDKLVTVLPSYKAISASAVSFRPIDSIREFSDSLLNIKKVINTTFTDSYNNAYSSLLKTSLSENVNFVISEGGSIKLNSANTSIYDRNSLSRFAHNTRILIDIKKKIKYGIFNSDLLFKNNSKIENVNANLNLLLTNILQNYVNNQIIQGFFVEIKTGQTRKEKIDVLNNILRTKIAVSLFGKSNDNIEEFNLASILNTTQNNLTETSAQDIILPSI